MTRRISAEFKQATAVAEKISNDNHADWNDYQYIAGMLLLDRGRKVRPLLVLFPEDHAVKERVDLVKHVGGFRADDKDTRIRDAGIDLVQLRRPKRKTYEIDPKLAQLINDSKGHQSFGRAYGVAELANPNFQKALRETQSWYSDPNLPKLAEQLAATDYADYLRWDLTKGGPDSAGDLKDFRSGAWRRLENDNNLGGNKYKGLMGSVANELHDMGSSMEEVAIRIAGRNIPKYSPTDTLQEAVDVIQSSGILDKHGFRPMGYGANGPSVYLDRLSAPPLIRDKVMTLYLNGRESRLNRSSHIAAAEVTRLVALHQLSL